MTIPFRGETGHGTYFVTSSTWMKKRLLQSQRSAELLLELMYQYRGEGKYLLHEFVVMNHFHLTSDTAAAHYLGTGCRNDQGCIFISGGKKVWFAGINLADDLHGSPREKSF